MNINLQNTTLAVCAGLPEQFPPSVLRQPPSASIKQIPQIAFSGRSNVGKSSLINSLLGRKSLARVSSAPGKTVTVNFYNADGKLFFVDLPGYGYAKRSFEERERLSRLGDGYFKLCSPLLVIQLIDLDVGPTGDDLMMLDFLRRGGIDHIIAATKSDKVNPPAREAAINKIPADPGVIIPFSSRSGEGKDRIKSEIFKRL